jgi:hypothetical protein
MFAFRSNVNYNTHKFTKTPWPHSKMGLKIIKAKKESHIQNTNIKD